MAKHDKPRVDIIGLGIMGGIMGETLLRQGFEVVGYDIVPECRARLRRAGGQVAASGGQVAQQCDVLIENYKVGDLARYGLGYDDLKKLNPGLIFGGRGRPAGAGSWA